jgi:hypothetical protein
VLENQETTLWEALLSAYSFQERALVLNWGLVAWQRHQLAQGTQHLASALEAQEENQLVYRRQLLAGLQRPES